MEEVISIITAVILTNMMTILLCLAIAIVTIIANWKVFKKCGEPGWKAIIPIYNQYTEFKLFWSQKMAHKLLILIACTLIAAATTISSLIYLLYDPTTAIIVLTITTTITAALSITILVLTIIKDYYRIQCFNMNKNYLALVLLGYLCTPITYTIFACINAYSQVQYKATNIKNETTSTYYKQYYQQYNQTNSNPINPTQNNTTHQTQNNPIQDNPIHKGE